MLARQNQRLLPAKIYAKLENGEMAVLEANDSFNIELPNFPAETEAACARRKERRPVKTKSEPTEADTELNAIAEHIRKHLQRITQDIIAIGSELIRAKKALGHGNFGVWLHREFGMTDRTARNYMQAAKWAEGKPEIISDLPDKTLRLLAAPSTPKTFTDQVLADLYDGKTIKHDELAAEIKTSKSRTKRRASVSPTTKVPSQSRVQPLATNQIVPEIIKILSKLSRADREKLRSFVASVEPEELYDALIAPDRPNKR